MKYKAPEGCPGVSVGGEQFNTDENGFVTVPDGGDYAALLAPHGFTPAPADESKDDDQDDNKASDGLTAAQIKEALTAKGIEFPGNANKADLAALLDAAPADESKDD